MLNPIRHRLSEAVGNTSPFAVFWAFVGVFTVVAFILGYTVGCHVGKWAAHEGIEPMNRIEVKR